MARTSKSTHHHMRTTVLRRHSVRVPAAMSTTDRGMSRAREAMARWEGTNGEHTGGEASAEQRRRPQQGTYTR